MFTTDQKQEYFKMINATHTLQSYSQVAFINGDFHKLQLFRRLIDAILFEATFGHIMISSYLHEFPELHISNNAEQDYNHIQKVYKKITNPSHPISAILLELFSQEEEMRKQITPKS